MWIMPIQGFVRRTIQRWMVAALYQNSANGNQENHCLRLSCTGHLRYILRHWLTLSFWPSVWGWYAVLICSWVPQQRNNSFQNALLKILSRSETIVREMPWSFTILFRKALATVCVVKGCFEGMEWLYLVNLSTTTMMTVRPSDLGGVQWSLCWYPGRLQQG